MTPVDYKEAIAHFMQTPEGRQHVENITHCGFTYSKASEAGAPGLNIWTLAAFIQDGQQVFTIGPAMQHLLMMTSLDNIDSGDVLLPYSSFYIALQDGGHTLHHPDSGLHRVAGVYCTKTMDKHGVPLLHIMAWAPPRAGAVWWDDVYKYIQVRLRGYIGDEIARIESSYPEMLAEVGNISMRAVAAIAIGACLYLSSKAEIEVREQHIIPRAERRRLRGVIMERMATTPRRVTIIAPTVERTTTPTALAELRNPMRKHWVRGHWHRFWVGTGESRRLVPKWVMPHCRGVGEADAVAARVYAIKASNG